MADLTSTIPKDWKMTTLGEVVEFQRGFDLPIQDRKEGKYPLVVSNGIDGYVSEYKVKSPGVVTGRSGSLGNLFFIRENFWPLNTTLWVKDFKGNDEKFIYYFLLSFPFEKYNAGTGVPTLNRNHIHQVEIMIAQNVVEQCAIAAVLSSLDDKIELLREQNKTLEPTAQAIFKEWFESFNFPGSTGELVNSELGEIPEGWRVEGLGKLVNLTIGRTPPRKELEWFSTNPKDIKWLSIRDLGNTGTYVFKTSEYLTKEAVKTHKIQIVPVNTVLVSFKLTVGRVAITLDEMATNEAIAHLRLPETSELSSEYLYLYFKTFDFNSIGSTSSIATAFNSESLRALNILIPEKSVLENFVRIIKPIFKKIVNNASQIQTLSALRDAFLPKLMKGDMRVKKLISNTHE